MKNPWEEIPLTDYENHMKLDSVMQLWKVRQYQRNQTLPFCEVSGEAGHGLAELAMVFCGSGNREGIL